MPAEAGTHDSPTQKARVLPDRVRFRAVEGGKGAVMLVLRAGVGWVNPGERPGADPTPAWARYCPERVGSSLSLDLTYAAGVVLWVFVDDEVEARLVSGNARLRPQDWKSGDRLWIVEAVAPSAAPTRC
jgi:hypothetical protein